MAFRLLPDGTLDFDSLDDALAAQAELANRLHQTSKARPQPNILRHHPISLTPIQQAVCRTVALRKEVDLQELADLHPEAAKDVGRFMKRLREMFAKAGYRDGDAMSWRMTGFGKNKRSVYSPGPSLLAAIESIL